MTFQQTRLRRLPAFAALVSIATFALLHWQGIALSPDGWAYWQGAVSLADGRGYRYFSGAPIIAWPPLYSAYLSLWVLSLGASGQVLVAANGVLIGLSAGSWTYALLKIHGQCRIDIRLATVVAIYIGLLLSYGQQLAMASLLQNLLLPLLLVACWNVIREEFDGQGKWVWIAAFVEVLLMLTHNNSAAFIGAVVLSLLVVAPHRVKAIHLLILVGFPIASWLAARTIFGQLGSHAIGLGVARHSPADYLLQLVVGVGAWVVPNRFGLPFLIFLLLIAATFLVVRSQGRSSAASFLSSFVFSAAGLLYGLFNVTWIEESLGGRYILFAPLILLSTLALASFANQLRTVVVVAVLCVFASLIYRMSVGVRNALHSTPQQLGFPSSFVLQSACLSSNYRQGAPTMFKCSVVISPIAWEEPVGRRK